jgi:hypothetical protein
VRGVELRFGWLVLVTSYSSTINCEQLKREESMLATMNKVEVKKEAIINMPITVTILPAPLRVYATAKASAMNCIVISPLHPELHSLLVFTLLNYLA